VLFKGDYYWCPNEIWVSVPCSLIDHYQPCGRIYMSMPLYNKSFYPADKRLGSAIAQAVSRRLPTADVRVRAQVRSCEISGGQSGTGAGFLRVLRFPLPIFIPPIAPHSQSTIRGWYSGPISGQRTKRGCLTPPQETI
jgi:hypothetical protein